jgi:hypothetical protein
MKAQQLKTTSTPVQTFESFDNYILYVDTGYYVKRPNPPTPEAVKRAQFVDKTYVWKESSKAAKPS